MPKYKVSYRREWEKEFDWLTSSKQTTFEAYCKVCQKNFRIDNSGKCQIKQHSTKAMHIEKTNILDGKTSQMVFSKNDTVSLKPKKAVILTEKQKILNAETLQALHVIEANLSFNQSADDSKRFRKQFPDSKIAESYSQGASKLKYTIEHGIAPYLHDIQKKDFQGAAFTFKYDETTTSQTKKQIDGYVQYWSDYYKKVVCVYIGSIFVGHCTAEDSVKHFHEFGKMMDWDSDLMLHLGQDGPRVNLSFEKKLQNDLNSDFLSLGSCNLHHVHNAFRAGLKEMKSFDVDEFINDVTYFFKLSSARREDYKLSEEMTDIASKMLLRHATTRWVTMKKSCLRLLEQWPNLYEYFINFLPLQKNYKSQIGTTERCKRIAEVLKSKISKAYLRFVAFAAQAFETFLNEFQSEGTKICDLYSSMELLLFTLMSRFVPRRILCDDSNKPLEAKLLSKIDCRQKTNRLKKRKMDIGTRTKVVLSDPSVKDCDAKNVLQDCQNFYVASVAYLQSHLPTESSVIRDVQYLSHQKRHDCRSLSSVSRLALVIGGVLGGQLQKYFGVSVDQCVEDICDAIRLQWIRYQSEEIPREWTQRACKAAAVPEGAKPSSDSYWSNVEESWIGNTTAVKEESSQVPIDEYWHKIGSLTNDDGSSKYPQLFALVKCCLSLSHGNATPERGFSVNKNILESHGSSLSEGCLVALRRIKDSIINHGGSLNIPITQELLKSVENAYFNYSAYVEAKKKADEAQARESEKKRDEARKRRNEADTEVKEIEAEIKVGLI